MATGYKTGGRRAGTTNRVTTGAKENIMEVFEMLGGAKGFADWAESNKTEFYRHYSKLIPVELSGVNGQPITLTWLK